MNEDRGHGGVGRLDPPIAPFTQLMGSRASTYDSAKLAALADTMKTPADGLSDGPDPEENLFFPAGYTYLGQFVDHDLTLDTTSTLNPDDVKDPGKPLNDPTNQRSPRFDLDCVYGTGPADQPFMYAVADEPARASWGGATLIIGDADLARANNGPGGVPSRAIIGDKRNDENSIVNQIQQLFIRFHNRVVDRLAKADASLRGGALFKRARDEVRWAYQRILLEDFLPRLVEPAVLDNFRQTRHYELYPDDERSLRRNLPREFVAAAYRFGHSGVRTGYRLNGQPGPNNGKILPIFQDADADNPESSLIGFDPLPASHCIDHWGRFFPGDYPPPGSRVISDTAETHEIEEDGGDGSVRLQYAYKIDPSLVDPLTSLPPKVAGKDDVFPTELRNTPRPGPSLALLNLLRGNRYMLPGGQVYAAKVGAIPLERKYLCTRTTEENDQGKTYGFAPIDEAFAADTPLWFYVLAEAQRPLVDLWHEQGCQPLTENQLKGRDAQGRPITVADGAGAGDVKAALAATRATATQLGPVGGRIVTEVFYGLMESDPDSVLGRRVPAGWQPVWGGGTATMGRLLRWMDPATAPV